MADKELTTLPEATSLAGGDIFHIKDVSNVDKKITTKNLISSKRLTRSFNTLADAVVAVAELTIGETIQLDERTSGNGGGALWKVVDATTVTENTFDIVAGDATRSFQLLEDSDKGITLSSYGFVADGVTDNSAALLSLLESPYKKITGSGVIGMSSKINPTLTSEKSLLGDAEIKWIGASNNDYICIVECDGNDFKSHWNFSGDDLSFGGLRVRNQTAQTGDLPVCHILNATFENFYMTSTASTNILCAITGSFKEVVTKGNTFGRVGRAAGTGVFGSSGTNGLFISHVSNIYYPKKVIHEDNIYKDIYSNEVAGTSADVDVDYFACFLPDPTNFPNGDSSFNEYPAVLVESKGNTYNNPIGRAEKFQCVGYSHHNTINRDGGRTIYSLSTDINMQWGVGIVRDITFNLSSVSGTSPITTAYAPISFYHGATYSAKKSMAVCEDITINNQIEPALNNNIDVICSVDTSATTFAQDLGLLSVRNITMPSGTCDHIVYSRWSTAEVKVKIENVTAEILQSVVGAEDLGSGIDLSLNDVTNLGSDVLAYGNYGGGTRTFGGILRGYGNKGISGTYATGASSDRYPMLAGAAIADGLNNIGGSLSVQSISLADSTTHIFETRGRLAGNHLVLINSNFAGASAVLNCTGASAAIDSIYETTNVFSLGTGSDPATASRLNIWVDANGDLNFNNLLGSTRDFTITFIG